MRTVVIFGISAWLVLAVVGVASAQSMGPGQYGPCCPMVEGRQALGVQTTAAGTTVTGPRYTCKTTQVSLAYGSDTHSSNMLEATGSLLCPARLFTMTGAGVEWGGNRHLVLTRGSRRVDMALGSREVQVTDGGETHTVSWPLCPRLINGIGYAPVRSLGMALGLLVSYDDGTVTLRPEEIPTGTTLQAATCPADLLDDGLGVVVLRSPAHSAFGMGVGVQEVTAGGLAEGFGLEPGDVIISCDGKPTQCPRELEQMLMAARERGDSVQILVVARGQEKLTLGAK